MDDLPDNNLGLFTRRLLLHVGTSVDLLGHLHCDIFNQKPFLLNGVEMLMWSTSKNYACVVKILEASLLVRRTKVAPGVLLAHARALSKATAKYPLTHVNVFRCTLPLMARQ